ncbi:hypothetical protein P3H15_32755 [Rhodococcus sp. T2V]|uniref:hypothetical protein n=1 Tax=Rhodococcus sp. T2V TaxID=3034164 RepID=UPI0023E1A597|nr:hypothetical protein [Rhodococcus sp. T2V]MDF3309791.1 hypothetical protein [Rhodococcus sp. T2V]
MSAEEIVQDLAMVAAVKTIAGTAETELKKELQEELRRGTVYAYDDEGTQLGVATVPKPSQPKPAVAIDDEARVLPWAVEMFGESAMTYRLTEQGRKSVIEYALAEHKAAGEPEKFDKVEGITVTVPAAKAATPRFTPDKKVVELVQGMVKRGKLSLASVLELGRGASDD